MKRTIRAAVSRCLCAMAIFGTLLSLATAAVGGTETWDFDLETSGEDVFYTSPTAVCTTAPEYDAAYEITQVEVMVSYLSIPFGPFDVTQEIPPEDRSGGGTYAGPPPLVMYDDYLRYPDPPEPITLAADLLILVDADGYGQVATTNIVLGTAVYDLGWPFGEVEVQLESVHVVGTVWVTPLVPGDVDRDGVVDLSDLATLLAHYGTPSGATYEDGDVDGDGDVDLADLAEVLGNYGAWDC